MQATLIRVLFGGSLLALICLWASPVCPDAHALLRLRGGAWCCDLAPDGQGNMICPVQGNPTPCPAPCTGGPAHVYIHNGSARQVFMGTACVQPPGPPFCEQPAHDTYGLKLCDQQGPAM